VVSPLLLAASYLLAVLLLLGLKDRVLVHLEREVDPFDVVAEYVLLEVDECFGKLLFRLLLELVPVRHADEVALATALSFQFVDELGLLLVDGFKHSSDLAGLDSHRVSEAIAVCF